MIPHNISRKFHASSIHVAIMFVVYILIHHTNSNTLSFFALLGLQQDTISSPYCSIEANMMVNSLAINHEWTMFHCDTNFVMLMYNTNTSRTLDIVDNNCC
eukprot:952470_1